MNIPKAEYLDWGSAFVGFVPRSRKMGVGRIGDWRRKEIKVVDGKGRGWPNVVESEKLRRPENK